jgi:homoserine kinase type II
LLPPLPEAALDDEEVAHIVGHYALGDMLSCEDLALGYINWNCAVETTQGRFFLKRRHPALTDPDLIQAQHQLIAHVRAQGIPAPRIQSIPEDVSYLRHGGHVYEVHEWTSGDRYDDQNPYHLSAVGEMLARYHLAARTFAPPDPLIRRQGWLYGPAILERVAQMLKKRWPALDNQWAAMRARAAGIGQTHPQHADLSKLVIHGDYYANNILFEGRRIRALLDYDNAAHQSRVVEVAEALIYFANQPDASLKWGVYNGTMNLEKAARFMAAYNAVWPLDAAEQAAVPATIQAIWLTVSLRRLEERPDASPDEVLARLHEAHVLADWAQVHSAQLAELAATTS